jgi:hypothetical protein
LITRGKGDIAPVREKGCLKFLYVELTGKYRFLAICFQKEFVDEAALGASQGTLVPSWTNFRRNLRNPTD